jgi:serpin B
MSKLCVVAGALLCISQWAFAQPEQDLAVLVDGNTEFALELFGAIRQNAPEANLFFSPYSISTALGMTYAGAEANTEAQMASTMHFALPEERLHEAFGLLQDRLSQEYRSTISYSEEPLVLEVANAIWVEREYELLPAFMGIVEGSYLAQAINIGFSEDPGGATEEINGWVAEKTHDRIRDLIPPGALGELTRIVLTNAVYFKGSWMSQFDAELTSERDFLTAGGDEVEVQFMTQVEYFEYCSMENCRAIELPYSDGLSSMLIILPDGGLAEFEEALDREKLDAIVSGLASTNVSLEMPRFEFTCDYGLNDPLLALGMTDAFGDRADFSGMTGTRDLFISAVLHKAFVKVDETGTEAAAATAVIMDLMCYAPGDIEEPIPLVLDRPFLFFVKDDVTGTILFMGRVADPRG